MKNRSLFVVFEGPDACGKSTVSREVQKKLEQYFNGEDKVVLVREPGGTEVGEKIRNILTNYDVDPRTEALLFAASRSENTWKNIMVAKQKNKIILCDRYLHSSLVYQGIVKNLGFKNILKINQFGIGKIKPDIVFYFDIDEKESYKRKTNDKTRNTYDRLENVFAQEESLKKIINGYYSVLKFDNRNIIRINALKTVEEISQQIFDIIISRAVIKNG